MKRWSRRLAVFVAVGSAVACSVMAWAGLEADSAQISLTARLLPSAELSLDQPNATARSDRQPAVSVVKITQTAAAVVAPADSVVEIRFTIKMNGRTARVTIVNHSKASAPFVSVLPATTDCDWVHASVPVEKARVVASLTGCTPHHPEQGTLHIQSPAAGTAITMIIEPFD